jgi:Mn-dependent DtxR family transcriptional regulator
MGLQNHAFPPIAATRRSAGELDYLLLRVISKLSPCSEGTLLKRINGESTSVRNCLARLVRLGLIELKNQKVIITDTGRRYVSPEASHNQTSNLPYNGSIDQNPIAGWTA